MFFFLLSTFGPEQLCLESAVLVGFRLSVCGEEVMRSQNSFMILSTFLWFSAPSPINSALWAEQGPDCACTHQGGGYITTIGAAKPWQIPPGLLLPLVSRGGWKHSPEVS